LKCEHDFPIDEFYKDHGKVLGLFTVMILLYGFLNFIPA